MCSASPCGILLLDPELLTLRSLIEDSSLEVGDFSTAQAVAYNSFSDVSVVFSLGGISYCD